MVSRKRHIAKAVTWRFLGTLDTMLVGWYITGDFLTGLSISAVESVTKIGLYYFHERAWYSWSEFGLNKKEEL